MTKHNPMRAIIFLTVLSCFLFLGGLQTAHAQDLNYAAIATNQSHLVRFSSGAEYAFVSGLGYGYILHGTQPTVLSGDVTVPWANPTNYRLRVGASRPLVGTRAWKLSGSLMPVVRGARTQLADMTNLGVETEVLGGYYRTSWFAGLAFTGDWAAATHIRHTAHYRKIAYAGAKDGWYSTTGVNLTPALVGGYSLQNLDFTLRAGRTYDLDGNSTMLPFAAQVGVNYRFND